MQVIISANLNCVLLQTACIVLCRLVQYYDVTANHQSLFNEPSGA